MAITLVAAAFGMLYAPDAQPQSVADLGYPWTIIFQGYMVAGGVLTIMGALPTRRWSRALEMLGMICMGTVFGTYAIGLIDGGNLRAFLAMVTYVVVSACCFLKAWSMWLESQIKLRALKRLPVDLMDGK